MQWCPSVGTTFHSSSTDEDESGTTVRFSNATSDREFVPNALINVQHIAMHIQKLCVAPKDPLSIDVANQIAISGFTQKN